MKKDPKSFYDKKYFSMRKNITMKYFLRMWPLPANVVVKRLLSLGIDISADRYLELLKKPESDMKSTDRFIMYNVVELIRQDIGNISDFECE